MPTCQTLEQYLVCYPAVSEAEHLQVLHIVQLLPQLRELRLPVLADDGVDGLDHGLAQEPVQDEGLEVGDHVGQLAHHLRLLVLVLDPLHLLIDPGEVGHADLGFSLLYLQFSQQHLLTLDDRDDVLLPDLGQPVDLLHVEPQLLQSALAVVLLASQLEAGEPNNY